MTKLATATDNPILNWLLTSLLPFITSPAILGTILNVILLTVKKSQSKAVARQIELTAFQTIGTMNAGDPAFVWPPPAVRKRKAA